LGVEEGRKKVKKKTQTGFTGIGKKDGGGQHNVQKRKRTQWKIRGENSMNLHGVLGGRRIETTGKGIQKTVCRKQKTKKKKKNPLDHGI